MEQLPPALEERVPDNQPLQLGHGVTVRPGREEVLRAVDAGCQVKLLEACGLRRRVVRVEQLGERLPSPQQQRTLDRRERARRVGLGRRTGLDHGARETSLVEAVPGYVEAIAT